MTTAPGTILLVEDNEDDVFLMERSLKSARIGNPMHRVEDGQQAMDYLAGNGHFNDRSKYPLPRAIFLDLKLPLFNGLEVLHWIRERSEFSAVFIAVLTSSNEPRDLKESYRLGANTFLVKPPTASQLLDLTRAFRWDWLVLAN